MDGSKGPHCSDKLQTAVLSNVKQPSDRIQGQNSRALPNHQQSS
jgi:hypothetical protein